MSATPAPASRARPGGPRRRNLGLAWAVLGVVLVLALAVGARSDDGTASLDDRVRSVSETVKCPTCSGQSVATSDAPAAAAIRDQIRRELRAGRNPDEIRASLAASFGDDIVLTPSSSGVGSLVWVLPVAGVVVAFAGLAVAFRRWQRAAPVQAPSDRDRALVAAARSQAAAADTHGEGEGR